MKGMIFGVCFVLVSCGIVEPELEDADYSQSIQDSLRLSKAVMPPHPRLLMISVRTSEQRVVVNRLKTSGRRVVVNRSGGSNTPKECLLIAHLYSPVKREVLVAFVDNTGEGRARRQVIACKKVIVHGRLNVKHRTLEYPKNWGILLWDIE